METTTTSTSLIHVSDVMSTNVAVAGMLEPLNEAVTKMLDRNVGCIVVTDWGSVVGIVTKGDVLRKAFLRGLEAREVSVKVAMTHPVISIDPDSTLEQASKLMTAKGISKLPVLKNKKLVGVITMSDIIRAEPMQVEYLQELVRARFVPHDLA